MQKIDAPFIEGFTLLNQFLQKNKISYCLIGGIAAGYWGEPRFTRDMDFTVVSPKKSFRPLLTLLKKEGYKVIDKGSSQIQITGRGKLQFIADLILSEIEYQDLVVHRAIKVEIFQIKTPICTPEDLIILKLIANRRQDLLDIETILNHQKNLLNLQYLHKWFKFWDLENRFQNEFGI